jgi:hypothetical protein
VPIGFENVGVWIDLEQCGSYLYKHNIIIVSSTPLWYQNKDLADPKTNTSLTGVLEAYFNEFVSQEVQKRSKRFDCCRI